MRLLALLLIPSLALAEATQPPMVTANVPPPETSKLVVWRYEHWLNDKIVVCLAEQQARDIAGRLMVAQEELDKARVENARNAIPWTVWVLAGIATGAVGGGAVVWAASR